MIKILRLTALILGILLIVLELISPHKTYAIFYTQKGQAFEKNHKIDQAIASYKKAIFHDPMRYYAYYYLATIYDGMGKDKEKNYYYEQAVLAGPDRARRQEQLKTGPVKLDVPYAKACFELGLFYKNKHNWPAAIALFKSASEYSNHFVEPVYELGLVYLASGQANQIPSIIQTLRDLNAPAQAMKLISTQSPLAP